MIPNVEILPHDHPSNSRQIIGNKAVDGYTFHVHKISIFDGCNWRIYGPVLVCIALILCCLLYNKISNCMWSVRNSKHDELVKEDEELGLTEIESRSELTTTRSNTTTMISDAPPRVYVYPGGIRLY